MQPAQQASVPPQHMRDRAGLHPSKGAPPDATFEILHRRETDDLFLAKGFSHARLGLFLLSNCPLDMQPQRLVALVWIGEFGRNRQFNFGAGVWPTQDVQLTTNLMSALSYPG